MCTLQLCHWRLQIDFVFVVPRSNMLFTVATLPEAFRTIGTRIWTFTAMNAQMIFQRWNGEFAEIIEEKKSGEICRTHRRRDRIACYTGRSRSVALRDEWDDVDKIPTRSENVFRKSDSGMVARRCDICVCDRLNRVEWWICGYNSIRCRRTVLYLETPWKMWVTRTVLEQRNWQPQH